MAAKGHFFGHLGGGFYVTTPDLGEQFPAMAADVVRGETVEMGVIAEGVEVV
jgi:hypothetical protein